MELPAARICSLSLLPAQYSATELEIEGKGVESGSRRPSVASQAIQGQITASNFHIFHCTNHNTPHTHTHTSNSVLVCFATAETKIESSRQVLLNAVK